ISEPPITFHNVSSSGSNKRTRITFSSSDENNISIPKSIDPKVQAYIDEQKAIIAE
ncbi:15761_t:CDS:1, partial [Funneliformis geosporum]